MIWSEFSVGSAELQWASFHNSDITMNAMASQITGISIVCSTACSGAHQRKHHSSASLAFERGWLVDSPHKGPVTRKMFLLDDVLMFWNYAIVMHWRFTHLPPFPTTPIFNTSSRALSTDSKSTSFIVSPGLYLAASCSPGRPMHRDRLRKKQPTTFKRHEIDLNLIPMHLKNKCYMGTTSK